MQQEIDRSIYEKLCDYCVAQERCAFDAKNKLRAWKVDSALHHQYIEKLRADKFIDEERYVKAFVAAYSRKRWGKNKIRAALNARGLNSETITHFLADLSSDEYREQIRTVAEKKWKTLKGEPRDRKTKLLRHLLSKGYEMDQALGVIKELRP